MAVHNETLATQRLHSWKEIAAFFGRAERTVKRWESERGLPVHRLPGGGRSAVFAYRHELAEWLKGSGSEVEAVTANVSVDDAVAAGEGLRSESGESFATGVGAAERGSSLNAAARIVALSAVVGVGMFLLAGPKISRASLGQHVSNAEAQDLYLKGRYYWDRRTPEDLTKAVDYFTQAIVKDPGDAQAYVGLADCYNLLREFGAMSATEAYPRALAAAQRAVELDGGSAEAHNSLAFATFWWTWQGTTAEREFKRGLQLNPSLARGHHWYATYLMALGRRPEALEQIDQAQRLEPASNAILADKAYLLWQLGRGSEALALLTQLEASAPSLSSTHYYLGKISWEQGNYSNAVMEWRKVAELRHDDAGIALADARAEGLAAGGLRGLLEKQLPLQKELVDGGGGSAYDLAVTYAGLDRRAEAVKYLQVAFDRRESGLLTDDPQIPNLQNDPVDRKLRAQRSERLSQ